MKVTHLSVADGPALAVDLHDRLTVVAGLGPSGRDRLAALFAGALRGEGGLEATVEVGGERAPLTADGARDLHLPPGLDPVVRPTDLPGAGSARPAEPAAPAAPPPDTAAVARALGEVHRFDAMRSEPDPDATALADRWAEATAALAAAGRDDAPPDAADEELQAAVARAEEELHAAEAEVERPSFDPADVRALEEAHARLLEAQDRAERRFAGPRARSAVAEARAAEDAVLARMALGTYTDYLMRTSLVGAGGDGGRRLTHARRAVEEARAELAAARAATGPARDEDELARAVEALREEAVALLGADPGDDVESALRACSAGARGMPGALADLRQALEDAGVDPGDDLVDAAERWLATLPEEEPDQRPEPEAAGEDPDLSAVDPRQLEVYLLARLATLRHAGRAGSVPLVVADAFAGAPEAVRERAHRVLLRFSDVVQVVYLSDDPAVQAWAEGLGPEQAAVHRAGAAAPA